MGYTVCLLPALQVSLGAASAAAQLGSPPTALPGQQQAGDIPGPLHQLWLLLLANWTCPLEVG